MKRFVKGYISSAYFVAFLLGFFAAFAFAPTYLFFFAIIGFSGLFLMIEKEHIAKRCFWIGWNFGFGHFLLGFYWISISLFVDLVKFGWLIPFAISLIPAAMAVYIGLLAILLHKIYGLINVGKLSKITIFCLLWVIFEIFRSYLFTGFPWNLVGYSLVFSTNISQFAAYFGIYGLSLLALFLYVVPAMLIEVLPANLTFNQDSKRNFQIISILFILIVGVSIFGSYRVNSVKLKELENGNVRIVQPSIEQRNKWNPNYQYESFFKNIKLSNSNPKGNLNYVIWSESAIPYLVTQNDKNLLNVIKSAVPDRGFVISGGLRADYDELGKIKRIYNSIFAIDDGGNIVDNYDKRHLVPFGEYIPFQKYLPFISKITNGAMGFSSGDEAKTIMPNVMLPSFSPLICYEVIFTNLAKSKKGQRPDFLLNLTNDAWFGKSTGPYQHLAMSRIRAIEYGISLVRVANSGVSAFIDPYGRIVEEIGLNEIATKDIKILEKIETTFYDEHGIWSLWLLYALILLPLILKNRKNVPKKKSNRSGVSKKSKNS